jgi:endonuclease I
MKKIFVTSVILSLFALLRLSYPQAGSYYDAIDVSSSTFISDLETRVRSPYTKISYDKYDETNIANFASHDNGDGTKTVTCVYTGYQYVYTGTFTWLPISREHTWCHSWMPSYSSESTNEYADQHHLFPVHQYNANVSRSNHPLGIVQTITSQFLEGKYGTNQSGEKVYEPRDVHKGDAARALLYMSLRYNGLNGYDWTFNWLNNTKLPALSEAPQDLNTLLLWHKQDPPNKWEVDRNNYIQSIQQNRNPFVDHPEYVNYINFNDLTKLNPVYAAEPDNYPTGLSYSVNATDVTVSWLDAIAGAQSPTGYLLIGYDNDNYFLPIDGEVYPDDADISDGAVVVNVPYAGPDSYVFNNAAPGILYYFTMYSYNGSGSEINYKINEPLPQVITPVELASFTAAQENDKIILNWVTATELNNYGFDIERRTGNNDWIKIGFVKGNGTSSNTNSYVFIDDKFLNNGKYFYRLKQIDYDGTYEYLKVIEINFIQQLKFVLDQNYPNPFNAVTTISFCIPESQNVEIIIYDELGNEVTCLVNEYKEAGKYNIIFNTDNLPGGKQTLASGIYFYQLKTGNFLQTKKLILLK